MSEGPVPQDTSRASGDRLASDANAIAWDFATAFSRALQLPGPRSMRNLENATVKLAGRMRDAGLLPEQSLIALKAMVRDAGSGLMPFLVRKPGALVSLEAQLYARTFDLWLDTFYRA